MKTAHFRRVAIPIILIICLASILVLSGCGKVNRENYNKLKVGMEYDEVLKILGKADNCESILNMKNCIWKESSKSITINIVADKVVFLSSHGI